MGPNESKCENCCELVEWMTLKDVIAYLPFSENKCRQLFATKTMPFVKIGKDYVTNKKLLGKFLEEYAGGEIFIA